VKNLRIRLKKTTSNVPNLKKYNKESIVRMFNHATISPNAFNDVKVGQSVKSLCLFTSSELSRIKIDSIDVEVFQVLKTEIKKNIYIYALI
jgi:hypothetical protein